MADFVLGRIKFKWRGDWAASTAYIVDDIVKYGANTYVCVLNHTSDSTTAGFYTDLTATKWNLHTEGLAFKGNWAATTHYKLNDLVAYGSTQYRCTTQHTSTSTFDSTKFVVYAEGLQFEDSYDSATSYQKGDVVTYGGYSYVAVATTVQGVTPLGSATEWDLLNPGFQAAGDYSDSTAYKTGDTVVFGGWSFVATANTTAGTKPTNATYWKKIVEGFTWKGNYNSGTTYYKGDTVEYASSAYVSVADTNAGITPGTDSTKWQLMSQGDTSGILTTRGDLLYRDATQSNRLPIGVAGAYLTTDGTDVKWSTSEAKSSHYVSVTGSDSNPGTAALPFKTINYALSHTTTGDCLAFKSISGGTGGTPGTFDVSSTGTTGSGTTITARITTDGSSTPTIIITNGGKNHVEEDTITFAGVGSPTASSAITAKVAIASVGDVINIKNGVYKENMPLRVPEGVTLQGESLRGVKVMPNYVPTPTSYEVTVTSSTQFTVQLGPSTLAHTYVSGGTVTRTDNVVRNIDGATYNNTSGLLTLSTSETHGLSTGNTATLANIVFSCLEGNKTYPVGGKSTQVATIDTISGGTGGTAGTYEFIHPTSSGSGDGLVVIVKTFGDSTQPIISIYHGGYGHAVNDTFTIASGSIGGATTLTFDCATLENNNAANMWLMNNRTNMRQMSFHKQDGIPVAKGTASISGGTKARAAIVSLDPTGSITDTSPYIQNCTSKNNNACGIQIDGNIHTSASSMKSMLANDFTQINSDGIGVHAIGKGRAETVSVFTYYCAIAYYASAGGFIRATNCSSSYGEKGAVADGNTRDEVARVVTTRGELLEWNPLGFTAPTSDADVLETNLRITGDTSGATAEIFRVNQGAKYIHIENRVGDFTKGEVCTVIKADSSTYQLTLANDGSSGSAQTGIKGALVPLKSADSTLGTVGVIKIGDNVNFAPVAKYPNAEVLITLNKEFLGDEIVAWFQTNYASDYTSERGVRFEDQMKKNVAAVAADLAAGTHSDTVERAKEYWIGTTSQLPAGEIPFHKAMNERLRDIINTNIFTNTTYTLHQTGTPATTQTTNATNAEAAATARNTKLWGYMNSITENGLTAAPANQFKRVSAVTEEDTTARTATVRLASIIGSSDAVPQNSTTNITSLYSNVRLTAHDWLYIGTGDIHTTNYPGTETQKADQGDEVTELSGGRVYFTSTDQNGDYRVGDLFKIEQATGTATLNADAFDLSGLVELQLGSIGAAIGSTVNEFSTDETMGGDSNTALPTESAVRGYLTRDKMGTGALVPPTGATSERPTGVNLYAGALRYNTTITSWEGYNGSQWNSLGAGNPWETKDNGDNNFTALSNGRYMCDTSTAAFTLKLPASPLLGDMVRILDLSGTFDTNNLTIDRNTKNINGAASDLTVSTENASIGLVYTGATKGWKLLENF